MRPPAEVIAEAARISPLTTGPAFSDLADADELRFREEVEPGRAEPEDVAAWMERKELRAKLEYALDQAGIEPAGTIVELGAGSCWLAAELARRPAVERVVAVEFSRHRLERLAPETLANIGAGAAKVERRLADFYRHGLDAGLADLVFTDAAFHHAADPVRLARVAYELLKPGGSFVAFREPTLSVLRRRRDHGIEDEHGAFEHEYDRRGYLRHLSAAGFDPRSARAAGSFRTPIARAILRPPLSWLNGIAFSEFTYVGRKPA
ncbi:MAG TPA: class I SAM-dependent methyltransferase [Thermoleophilaceae bacterium]